jgi:hypothetical protein
MQRSILVISAALVLVALLAPTAFAADDPTPAATAAPEPTPVTGQGEIVIDPTFITATPIPEGDVAGTTGRPDVTPPPTDSIAAATRSGSGLQVLLVLLVVGSLLAMLGSREPARRRR